MDSLEETNAMISSALFSSTSTSISFQLSSLSHPLSHNDESPPPAPPPLVIRPCGACKVLRRRCVATCILAPYFPPTQPLKFLAVHKVFGASNVSKFLQGIPESQRADAVDSMVYEGTTRIRDPVYGCAGLISNLQKLVNELQMELATAKAQLLSITSQQDNLQATKNTSMEINEAQLLQGPSLEEFMFCATPFSLQNCKNFSWDNSFLHFDDKDAEGI
ncbi:LOB domain-containing protein 1-like [Macadamia integrifolia]|uniref:LOB domain-containing protein 1-like n=1 Tax=Macadamia integrifolia TaxID=60698 RepID=UPI001C4E4860|nr:LOB domain-containing protein 1-like [Macadamia integrifolia]